MVVCANTTNVVCDSIDDDDDVDKVRRGRFFRNGIDVVVVLGVTVMDQWWPRIVLSLLLL